MTQESSQVGSIVGISDLEANIAYFFQALSLRKGGEEAVKGII